MATNVTWGVTSTTTGAWLAQYTHDNDSWPVDTTSFPLLLAQAAAEVNSAIIAAQYTLSEISDDSTTVAYLRAQLWTTVLCAGFILRSTTGADPELATNMIEEVREQLKALVKNPALLGADADEGGVPQQVSTTTDRLNLDTTETYRAKRRRFDDVTGRTTGADDPRYW